jgi:UDP-glucose 4-epimerase
VLEAARVAGVRRVVNSSSGGAAYGDADLLPTPEDYPVRPLSPYGQSKYLAESYAELYSRIHGLSTISLRYSNVYGPRQDPHGEGGVVAIFCGCLIEGRQPVVFGDGRQTRDWVDVSDVVQANVLACESELTGPVNIGRGEESSVLELIEALNEVGDHGRLAEPVFAAARRGEVRRSCLDVSWARLKMGWEAEVGLPDGLQILLDSL